MVEFTSLEVSMWINKLNLNFNYALIHLGLSCISSFHQIKVDEPLLRATTKLWIPTQHVSQFNDMELCPTLKEFGVIILLTLKEDLSDLAHQLLGVPLAMAKRWCKSNKLNVFMVFK